MIDQRASKFLTDEETQFIELHSDKYLFDIFVLPKMQEFCIRIEDYPATIRRFWSCPIKDLKHGQVIIELKRMIKV